MLDYRTNFQVSATNKHYIFDLNAYREQSFYFQCPYCYEELKVKDIIGFTEYNVCRIGHSIGGKAIVFECPKCFEKSFCHKNERR